MPLRVAVIAPPYPLEEAPAPPLGVCYVAAAFEEAGAEVEIFDFVVSEYSRDKLEARMKAFQPDVVGSTAVTMTFPGAARIISDAKEIDPGVTTLMGGPHVSFWAREALAEYPALDMIVLGEGEATIPEIMPYLAEREKPFGVHGLAFRNGNGTVMTRRREFIRDLDSLPLPARHLLPISRYQALGFPVSVITSRGCPNRCIFCLGRRMVGHKVRYRDPRLVVDEIEHLLAMGFNRINVADDLFTSNRKRMARFCDEISSRGLSVAWSAFSRVNTIDRETVRMMRDTGCDCISFGIESGNPEMLQRVKKGITLDQARRAVGICKDLGVLAHASFMVGLPGETPETLADSDRFARELGAVYGYHFLAPFPGTTVMEEIENYDLEVLSTDWSLYDANRPVVQTSAVSAADAASFVARYDEECQEEWERLEKGFEEGTNTPEEDMRILGNRKLSTVFAIISGDLVEKHGRFDGPETADPDELLSRMGARISADAGLDSTMAGNVLWEFFKKGHIRLLREQDKARWEWSPNPPAAWVRPGKKAV